MCALDYMPFTYQRNQEQGYIVDVKSLIQASIIAIGTGLIVMYGTQQTLSMQLESIKEDVSEVKDNQRRIMKDLYIPQWDKKN